MGSPRARAEKSVLSKQAITNRRRAPSDQKPESSAVGHRAIGGIFVAAASLLSLVALITFESRDRGPNFRNAAGPVGHMLADSLHGFFGVCAYVIPLVGVYAAVGLITGKKRRRWPQMVSLGLLIVSASILADIASPTSWGKRPGGVLGATLGEWLQGFFSTTGTLIVVAAVCSSALIIGTQFAFLKACAALGELARASARAASRGFVGLVQATKRAVVAGRLRAAEAKLEKAALLAQLEADEDELAAAEGDASDAEAIAIEAERLARESEGRAPRSKDKSNAAAGKASAVGEADPPWITDIPPVQPKSERKREKKGAAKEEIIDLGPPVAEPAPSIPLTQPTAALPPPPVPSPEPIAAASIRKPLIVEPKAPPAPTKKKETEQFEFVGDRKSFTLPPVDLLVCEKKERTALDNEAFLTTAERLRAKLADFGIDGDVVEIRPGPVVTMYEFLPGPGIKISKIAGLADDLAMAMEAMRVRIVAPIPGKGVVGIEVPNKDREMVYLKEIAEQDVFHKSTSRLTMCVGKDIEGMPYVLDLAKAPHLLIAGTTGSGKSVAVNAMIMSILLKSTPEEVRFVMVDPKMLELSVYEGIPHLLLPVVTDPKKAALALRWSVEEMERRYRLLSDVGVRNIAGYNKLVESLGSPGKDNGKSKPERNEAGSSKKLLVIDVADGESEEAALARQAEMQPSAELPPKHNLDDIREPLNTSELNDSLAGTALVSTKAEAALAEKKELTKLPYIVVIIDELADLMMVASREVEMYIARLAQMARAAGIHLMVATQRPSTDVVTGVIKANFPTRVSFMLRSKPDSMTILGQNGAEALLGMGDMLIMPPTSAHLQRVHGAFVSELEIKHVVDHLKAQGKPVYDETILKAHEDELDASAEDDGLSDELYDQALAVIAEMRTVSISMLQRKMRIGYNRSARMIERMEKEGIVGPADGAKPREVLIRPVGEMPGAGAI